MDALKEKTVYPCESASVEQLDKMLRQMMKRGNGDLHHFVFPPDPREVRWENVRHLRIINSFSVRAKLESRGISSTQGFFSNADGSWLLVSEGNRRLEDHVSRCGEQLESLRITDTGLTTLQGLGNLPRLTLLSLSHCESLTELQGLENLTQLTALDLYKCHSLTELQGLGNLTRLTTLDLFNCRSITKLTGLENLTQLTELNLSGCRCLTELTGLRNMSKLICLSLGGCGLLTELDLSGCSSLTELSGLGALTELTSLDLSGCSSLTKLLRLKDLTRLITLNLNGCSSLTKLDLSGCSSLAELLGLGSLTRLTALDLSNCRSLTDLPELPRMGSLRRLYLLNLRLRDLPDWLPEIAEDFSPKEYSWDEGKNKANIYLHNTSVDSIPDMSIFEQPYEVVAEFFRNRALGRTRTLNEIKVVFLGDGEAGKSHTIARLMNDGGEPVDYVDSSTPGIVIKRRKYTVDGRQFQVNYWDFGGQEIMHSMHRIFLTGRTMYVVLLNARYDTQGDRAHYWLHNIQSFAPGAPVLLVLNKIDQNPKASVDERTLRSRYPVLTEVVKLSALKFGKEEFNRAFTDALLHQIRRTGFLDAQWPEKWVRVKEELENMTEPYILGNAYKSICRRCQVYDLQTELLHWFNDLGVSFCFCDKEDYALRKHVILRPDWITNGLYIILFNECAGFKNGQLPHAAIYDLLERASDDPTIKCSWPEARYDRPGDVEYVLGVMRKFQLSLDSGDGSEFIPMLCQQDSTIDIHYYERDAELLEFSMAFDYLPDNLLHRLMVERYGELNKASAWRKGARFQFKELGYSAVVLIDGNTLRFFIRHTDPMHRPNTYLTMLKANVDRIVEKMGLKAPSNQLIYKLDGKQDVFDYEMLKAMQEAGQTQAFSMTCRRMLPIADILNQSAPDVLDDEKKLLDAIIRSCRRIQDEPTYRLIRNVNGNGYSNGKGMEDQRNRRIRDDLIMCGYRVSDQSQRGSSGTGRSVGELDMLITGETNEPWTIIEALRVSDGAKSDWNAHLDKLLGNYNSRGLPRLYLLTYVDADPAKFANIWAGYQDHIVTQNPGIYTYSKDSFLDLNEPNTPQYIKAAKCHYSCGDKPVTVYHIFARIPTQEE